MKDKILVRVFAFFIVLFAVVALVAFLALRSLNRAAVGTDWVNHTHAAIHQLGNVVASLRQAEGYTYAYALTGEARDLGAARGAFAQLGDNLDTAKALIRDDAAATALLQQAETAIQGRETLAQGVWAARSAGQLDKMRGLVDAGAGSAAVAQIERTLDKLRDAQFDLLRERDHAAYAQAQAVRWTVGVAVGSYLLLMLAVGWLLRDDIAARRRAARALEEANAVLEEKVRERTADLLQSNQQLRTENRERKWTITSQEHQLRYNQLIIESVDDMVFVVTKALNVTRINPVVVHVTGLEDDAILTKPLGNLISVATDPSSGLDPMVRALQDGRELRRHPVTVLARNERRLPAVLTLVPLRDQDKVVGGVAIVDLAPETA